MNAKEVSDIYLAIRCFRELLIKTIVIRSEQEIGGKIFQEFSFTGREYLTIKDIEEFIGNKFPTEGSEDLVPLVETIAGIIGVCGLIMLAIDEYHFPPKADIGLTPEFIHMAKFCMVVFSIQEKESISIEDIENLINANIGEFIKNLDGFEPPKVLRETATAIYNKIDLYFV